MKSVFKLLLLLVFCLNLTFVSCTVQELDNDQEQVVTDPPNQNLDPPAEPED